MGNDVHFSHLNVQSSICLTHACVVPSLCNIYLPVKTTVSYSVSVFGRIYICIVLQVFMFTRWWWDNFWLLHPNRSLFVLLNVPVWMFPTWPHRLRNFTYKYNKMQVTHPSSGMTGDLFHILEGMKGAAVGSCSSTVLSWCNIFCVTRKSVISDCFCEHLVNKLEKYKCDYSNHADLLTTQHNVCIFTRGAITRWASLPHCKREVYCGCRISI